MIPTCDGCEVSAREIALRHDAADMAQLLSLSMEGRRPSLAHDVLLWLTRFARGTLCLGVLTLCGCAGNAAIVEALAKDDASVCLTITSIYGRVQLARSKITSGEVTCTTDGGLSVRADKATP
jgi:hypothetical protein